MDFKIYVDPQSFPQGSLYVLYDDTGRILERDTRTGVGLSRKVRRLLPLFSTLESANSYMKNCLLKGTPRKETHSQILGNLAAIANHEIETGEPVKGDGDVLVWVALDAFELGTRAPMHPVVAASAGWPVGWDLLKDLGKCRGLPVPGWH